MKRWGSNTAELYMYKEIITVFSCVSTHAHRQDQTTMLKDTVVFMLLRKSPCNTLWFFFKLDPS